MLSNVFPVLFGNSRDPQAAACPCGDNYVSGVCTGTRIWHTGRVRPSGSDGECPVGFQREGLLHCTQTLE
jgi:hypothetical protein